MGMGGQNAGIQLPVLPQLQYQAHKTDSHSCCNKREIVGKTTEVDSTRFLSAIMGLLRSPFLNYNPQPLHCRCPTLTLAWRGIPQKNSVIAVFLCVSEKNYVWSHRRSLWADSLFISDLRSWITSHQQELSLYDNPDIPTQLQWLLDLSQVSGGV